MSVEVESCVFQEMEPAVSTEKHEHLAYTTTWPKTNILPELLLIVQTTSPCRIISIKRKMEERNNGRDGRAVLMEVNTGFHSSRSFHDPVRR